MNKSSHEFNQEQKWLKTYEITWNTVKYNNGDIKTLKHDATISARNFLDALAKATVELHQCQAQYILSIQFKGMVKVTEGDRDG